MFCTGGTERVIVDDVTGGSQLMMLPGVDAQYRLTVAVVGQQGEGSAQGGVTPSTDQVVSDERLFRTLPYVNCECQRYRRGRKSL